MNEKKITFICKTENELQNLARSFSPLLCVGDLIALYGELGAGKTSFARALLKANFHEPRLEVPSPTFTLAQHYESKNFGTNIAHFDLYRLNSPAELEQLGLEESLENSVVFVEWANKGNIKNATFAITIEIGKNDERQVHFVGCHERLARLSRSLQIENFLQKNNFENAHRKIIAGDASVRCYEVIFTNKNYILMDDKTKNLAPFIAVGNLLQKYKFKSPKIYATDSKQGFMCLQHLGNDYIFDSTKQPIKERYEVAIELLVDLQKIKFENNIKNKIGSYTSDIFQNELSLLPTYYVPFKLGNELSKAQQDEYKKLWQFHLAALPKDETLVLRDYHSPNILWQAGATGNDRIGLIDFQDALFGTAAYDVASLVHDARLFIDEKLESHLVNLYCQQRKNFNEENFLYSLKLMQAQRASKVLGIFVRLAKRDGKKNYLQFLPQVENYLSRALNHKKLSNLKSWYNKVLAL